MNTDSFIHLFIYYQINESLMRTSIIFDPVKYQGYKSICFYLKDIGEIFCSIFCSFYLKLVLKNPPGYRPRQVCDFAQGDIRSWVQRGS